MKSVRLPMLTDLKLHNCEGITSSSMSSVAYSHMLKVDCIPVKMFKIQNVSACFSLILSFFCCLCVNLFIN